MWMMTEHGLLEHPKASSVSLFVLYLLLLKGPMSGYELAQLIKERSHGHFQATTGDDALHVFTNSKRRVMSRREKPTGG